jgi:hypothetical protein
MGSFSEEFHTYFAAALANSRETGASSTGRCNTRTSHASSKTELLPGALRLRGYGLVEGLRRAVLGDRPCER